MKWWQIGNGPRVAWVALALALGTSGCSFDSEDGSPVSDDAEESETPDPATLVEIEPLGRGSVSELLLTSAVVESESMADVYPVAAGQVLEVRVDEGDPVRKGQVLAVIENVSLDAGRERAASELVRLEDQLAEMDRLHQRGAVSDREMEDLSFQVRAARSAHREAASSYAQTKLEAPFAGLVALRDIRVGEFATSSRRAFQVVDMNALRVVASLPERDVSRVAIGQVSTLISAYDEGVVAPGRVERIAPVIDPSSGTFRVTVGLEPGQNTLRPGQFVSVQIEVDQHTDVLVVAKSAVVYDDGRPVVYRMVREKPPEEPKEGEEKEEAKDEGGGWFVGLFSGDESDEGQDDEEPKVLGWVAERVPVELGLADAITVEILSGLEEGDSIITVGQSNLKDGSEVRTHTPSEDAAAAPASQPIGDKG